jgi:hypothetical protein
MRLEEEGAYMASTRTASIRTVGSDGRVAIGKQYAGRRVVVDQLEPGVWVVKVGEFIPDSERWLHEPETKAKIDRAIAWAESHPPQETDLNELEERLLGERSADTHKARSQ